MNFASMQHTPNNYASTPPLSFLQAGCPSCRQTNSVKAAAKLANLNKLLCRILCNVKKKQKNKNTEYQWPTMRNRKH